MEEEGLRYESLPCKTMCLASFRGAAERTGIREDVVDKVIAYEEREVYYYLEDLADSYIDFGFRFDFRNRQYQFPLSTVK